MTSWAGAGLRAGTAALPESLAGAPPAAAKVDLEMRSLTQSELTRARQPFSTLGIVNQVAKEVMDYLKSEHGYGNKDSRMGKALERRFCGTGYGWEGVQFRVTCNENQRSRVASYSKFQ